MLTAILLAAVAFAVAEWLHHKYEVRREEEEMFRTGRMGGTQ